MYQLDEVKRFLVEYRFSPADGWDVTVDLDAMELAEGGQHPPDKREVVSDAKNWLRNHNVKIGSHREFGRAEVVAIESGEPLYIVEVEGKAQKSKAQAMYSALRQTIIMMSEAAGIKYALAVPDTLEWERQLKKIPMHVRTMLNLDAWLVSYSRVRSIEGE